jgi:hypothetical protein
MSLFNQSNQIDRAGYVCQFVTQRVHQKCAETFHWQWFLLWVMPATYFMLKAYYLRNFCSPLTYWRYVFSSYTLKMPQTSTLFSRPNSFWSRFDDYPPAAPPAEILVSTSGFGPGGVSGPYRILMSLCKKPSCCGAGCSQGDNFCSAHTLLDEESD